MFKRFGRDAGQSVAVAVSLARELRHPVVRPEHLLVGVFRVDGVAAKVLSGFGIQDSDLVGAATGGPARQAGLADDEVAALRTVGIDADDMVRRAHEAIGPPPAVNRRPRFDGGTVRVLELSLRELSRLGHRRLGTEHILLAVLAAQPRLALLDERGVSHAEAERRVLVARRRAG